MSHDIDKTLIRAKDIILAVVAIGGIAFAFVRWADSPKMLSAQAQVHERKIEEHDKTLSEHSSRLNVLSERIDNKIGEMNGKLDVLLRRNR